MTNYSDSSIRYCLNKITLCDALDPEVRAECFDLISKSIPAKPLRHTVVYPYKPAMEVLQCPGCLRRLRTKLTTKQGDKYCPDCGQRIK